MVTLVLYAVDKGLRGRNVLQSVVIDFATYLLTISSPDINNVAMTLYDIILGIPCMSMVVPPFIMTGIPAAKCFSNSSEEN